MRRNCLITSIVCLLICVFSVWAMAETLILKLNKTEIPAEGEEPAKFEYIVKDKELKAVGKAGVSKGVDVVLVNVDPADVDAVKSDASYIADSFLELAIKDPALAEDVLEMEYEVDGAEGKEIKRAKVSQWKKDGSPSGRVRLPVQISGVPSELEYDSKGALKGVE